MPSKIVCSTLFTWSPLINKTSSKITNRVVDVSVLLVVDEDEPCAAGVGVELLDAHNMLELVHVLPVLDVEVVQATILYKGRANVQIE